MPTRDKTTIERALEQELQSSQEQNSQLQATIEQLEKQAGASSQLNMITQSDVAVAVDTVTLDDDENWVSCAADDGCCISRHSHSCLIIALVVRAVLCLRGRK